MDLSHTIVANSNQLNADDLLGRTLTDIITKVEEKRVQGKDQVVVHLKGHKPWRTNMTSRRLLDIGGWDIREANLWVGRTVQLRHEPAFEWSGEEVGGIAPSGMSDIKAGFSATLQVRRGKKVKFRVDRIAPLVNLESVLTDTNITVEQLDEWAAAKDKPPVSTLDDDARARLAQWLSGRSADALDEIRGGGK